MIDFASVKAITIPEGKVKQIARKSDGVVLWKSGYKNWVKYSTEADGKTIYNGGLGYKSGYRIRSGGAEATNNNSSITGYIPAKAGNTVRLSGYNAIADASGAGNAINLYDENYTHLGQLVGNSVNGYGIMQDVTNRPYNWSSIVESPTGVYVWIVAPDSRISYIRVTGLTTDGSKMIVTVNEEIA